MKPWLPVIFLGGLALTVGLQYAAGAYAAELGALNSDEAPHYINGLLIARYVATGWGVPPMAFAAAFYRDFPKVSIGHWPPLFYVVEAAWMLVASASRASVMLLSAVITTGLATVLAAVTLRRQGVAAAAAVAAAFLLLPLVREMTAALLVDIAVALLDLLAALAFIAYVQRPGWRRAAWFGLAASAAIMTKGNGLALALLPPAMILLTRRFGLLRRGDFWLPVAVAGVLCGPWYIATRALAEDGFFYHWGLAYTRLALVANAGFLVAGVGVPGLVLAAAGAAGGFRRDAPDAVFRRGLLALAGAVFVFQAAVPVDLQSRYMIPLFGPLILLAAAGVGDLTRGFSRRVPAGLGDRPALGSRVSRSKRDWVRTAGAATAMLASLAALPGLLVIERKPSIGMREAAGVVLAGLPPGRAVLIAAGAPGEGAFIVEMALREAAGVAPVAIARGTKLLASADFNGEQYVGRFSDAAELAAAIHAAAIGMVVLDTAASSLRYPHNRLVQQAAAHEGWPMRFSRQHDGMDGLTQVFEVPGPAPATAGLLQATCSWRPGAAAAAASMVSLSKPATVCRN